MPRRVKDYIDISEYTSLDDLIRRTPVTPAMILESLEAGKRVDRGLTSHV